jgi:hypothetical protein
MLPNRKSVVRIDWLTGYISVKRYAAKENLDTIFYLDYNPGSMLYWAGN